MFSIFKSKKQETTDSELLELYKNTADLSYLGDLYDRYLELIYGTCLKYLKHTESAEDTVMEIFEVLTKKILRHNIKEFRPWLYVLVKNHCLQKIRKEKKSTLTILYDGEFMHSDQMVHPIDESEESKEATFVIMETCLEKLPEKQKECVQLFYYEGKSYKDIADFLNLPVGKIRSYIQNGRRNLKLCMEKNNG